MAKPGPKPGTHHAGTFKKNDPRINPGGVTKEQREWKAWCKEVFNTEDIREHTLRRIKKNDNLLMWLGEQANGRATQAIEGKIDVSVRLRRMTDAEIEAEIKQELKALHEVVNGP
jgi:hypothetical protein